MESKPGGGGTQLIGRTVSLLKTIATRPQAGWRTSDLARHCGLDEGTTRRILKRLALERAVRQDPQDRRYRPGPLLFELGLCAADHYALSQASQPRLERLAHLTGGVALLYLRSSDEFVCIARAGPAASHWAAINVGTRRSLGSSAGGIAILLALPADQQRAVLARCEAHARERGTAYLRKFRGILARSRDHGAGVNISDGLQGVTALAVALRDRQGTPFASLGVSAPLADFTPERVPGLLALLETEVRAIETELPPALF